MDFLKPVIWWILATPLSAFLGAYVSKYAEQKAILANVAKITKEVEGIKSMHKKELSEYDIKLENFKKVIEVRLLIFNCIAQLRTDIWNLFNFKIGTAEEITKKFQVLTTQLNVYHPLIKDCESEIEKYAEEIKEIDYTKRISNEIIAPVDKKLSFLMEKLLEYKKTD